jgi:hypothetical protein
MSDVISIPFKTNAFLFGEDILYKQFNDVDFYIEDKDSENLYYVILKSLFSSISFEKIFPLNGKTNVIDQALLNVHDKNKVYLVDKDFDDILNIIVCNPNLFYLSRYSIENYLLEEEAIVEYIIENKPSTNRKDIHNDRIVESAVESIKDLLIELTCYFFIIMKYELGIKFIKMNPEQFIQLDPPVFRPNVFSYFENDINRKLLETDNNLSLYNCVSDLKKSGVIRNSIDDIYIHCPGKYIVCFLKKAIEIKYHLRSTNTEEFCYRVAKNSKFSLLTDLKNRIESYIS